MPLTSTLKMGINFDRHYYNLKLLCKVHTLPHHQVHKSERLFIQKTYNLSFGARCRFVVFFSCVLFIQYSLFFDGLDGFWMERVRRVVGIYEMGL